MKMDALEEALKANQILSSSILCQTSKNPTGRTMTEERRKQLAELAEKYDVYVLEDNPYGEIRFAGQHVPAVKSFDKSGHVFYMSTFFKDVSPRISFRMVGC